MHAKKFAILGSRGIPASYGGFETFTEELAVRLAIHNVSVSVYCVPDGANNLKTYKGVELIYISSPRLGPLTTILFDLLCLWHARKRYDIVYMLGYGSSLFCWLPRLWRSTVWINMDGIEWARAKWGCIAKAYFKIMEAIAMRTADRIIADAASIKEILYHHRQISTPCSVIPYGTMVEEHSPDATSLAQWGLDAAQYYLVVCRLEPENHVLEIIRGHQASLNPAQLIIVGDHHIKTAYIQILFAEKNDNVRFIGAVYNKDLLRVLRYYCKAYFHGHSVGGTNPSLLEALGCGNLVLAHDNVFNREVAGDTALYFMTEKDIPAILARVDAMDSSSRLTWSDRSRQRVQDSYTWEKITDMYISLLDSHQSTTADIGI